MPSSLQTAGSFLCTIHQTSWSWSSPGIKGAIRLVTNKQIKTKHVERRKEITIENEALGWPLNTCGGLAYYLCYAMPWVFIFSSKFVSFGFKVTESRQPFSTKIIEY